MFILSYNIIIIIIIYFQNIMKDKGSKTFMLKSIQVF